MPAYPPDLISRAKDFAELLMSDRELASILEVPLPTLRVALADPADPLGEAVRNARLVTTAALNRSKIDLAIRGSATAHDAVDHLIRKLKS